MPKPKIEPSRLGREKLDGSHCQRNWSKSCKELAIDEVKRITCEKVPAGSKFKGYKKFIVQDLHIQVKTTAYELEQWQTPDGNYVSAELPAALEGSHFGPGVRRYILYQHHSNRVTQNKIHEELREMGFNISVGQIDAILARAVSKFKQERDDILEVGLRNSSCIQADDTGARHAGKNGYCLVVRNDLFAYYASTNSKSRLNFLQVLRGGNTDFVIDEATIDYCILRGFKDKLLDHVRNNKNKVFQNEQEWDAFLCQYAMTVKQQRVLTEGAIIGSLFFHGLPRNIALVSDDAGQFNLFIHALCWAHAIRNIKAVIAPDDQTSVDVDHVIQQIREYYRELKAYAEAPSPEAKAILWSKFDTLVAKEVSNPALRKALAKFACNKAELLRVLDFPNIPLTNNGSERDIRPYVIKRKISGTTRNQTGRNARDVFTSLSATCRKNGISFWTFLKDRIDQSGQIPYLPKLIWQRSQSTAAP